jgi:hypothetical protein
MWLGQVVKHIKGPVFVDLTQCFLFAIPNVTGSPLGKLPPGPTEKSTQNITQ